MNSYSIKFTPNSKKAWDKLDKSIKIQFQKKLKQRVQNPKVEHDKLSGFESIYKIKLRSSGYRLAYELKENQVVIIVLKIGKRDKFYENLQKFFKE